MHKKKSFTVKQEVTVCCPAVYRTSSEVCVYRYDRTEGCSSLTKGNSTVSPGCRVSSQQLIMGSISVSFLSVGKLKKVADTLCHAVSG